MTDAHDPTFLDVPTRDRGTHLLVSPAGEIDAATAPLLGEVLRSAARDGAGHVVLDLERVDFIDSSGLGVLLNAHRRLTRAGRRFHLAVPEGGVVHRLLRQTDLLTTFKVHESRREAERAVAAA